MNNSWRSSSGGSLCYEDARDFWAKIVGVRGPQWMIVVALQRLDHGGGAPVTAIAELLHVNPIFVMTQSGLLEKKGLVRRIAVNDDPAAASLLLTDKASRHLANQPILHRGRSNSARSLSTRRMSPSGSKASV
jgi:MarR family transcriptional regulator, organic hydroperoxide resistance regulator